MDELLSYARAHRPQIIELIREMVECESPSRDAAAVARMADLVASKAEGEAKVRRLRGGHLRCEFRLPGKRTRASRQILVLGHLDTVWPLGTLASMPFRRSKGRLWGPGVLDMKSGIAFFLYAVRALRELELPVSRRVTLLLNSDEEIGSLSSRAVIEREAARSAAVLVLEPGTGLEGKLKTARKGVALYEVRVEGKAVHSGIDFPAGASAIVELAHQIVTLAGFTSMKKGLTVNPGTVSGGTGSNIVAAEARTLVDVRLPRLKDAAVIDRKIRALKVHDKRCKIHVSGGLNRPPMERTPAIAGLFRTAHRLGRELGVELEESMTGGGSDGNFTAALGVPTLDGLGGVGEGAHASNESILINRITDRTALIAKLIHTL